MNNNNIKSEELKDKSKELVNKCTEKKKKNPKFSSYIEPLVSKKLTERIKECGDFLQMLSDLTLENSKLHKASFCGNRFCPMCSWRIACKDSLEISILMEHLRKEENKEFIFLTLTTPNVKGSELDSSIKSYNKAFKKLMERKEVKNIVKGYIRKLEVTYNADKTSKSYDTYHPHFHVVLAINRSYFTDTKQYINHDRWLNLWIEATGDFSITQVDVRKAKANDYKEVYELAKYSAKDTDYLINREVFTFFYKALKGKQVLVFSGLFKDAHKMYQNGELDVYKKLDPIEYAYMVNYNWLKNKYDTSKIRELTEEEKQKFNKNLISELDCEE
jgi:plasmid rolling circle replication initiator protein Rep